VIIGAGVGGTAATRAFLGNGAHVTVLDIDLRALQRIDERCPQAVTMIATPNNIARTCAYADVVVGAVLVPGERAPIVVKRENVKSMKPRSLIIDMSIDQGGCVETSRPTTHDRSTYVEEGVTHYCMPLSTQPCSTSWNWPTRISRPSYEITRPLRRLSLHMQEK
jgi:alanine dehydrogenase